MHLLFFLILFFCPFVFVLLSAGFKEEDLGSCSHPACRAELFGWRVTSSAEGLLANTTSTPGTNTDALR